MCQLEGGAYCHRCPCPRALRLLHFFGTFAVLILMVLWTVSFYPILSTELRLVSYAPGHKYDCSMTPLRFAATCGSCYDPNVCLYESAVSGLRCYDVGSPLVPKNLSIDGDWPCGAMCGAPPHCSNRGMDYSKFVRLSLQFETVGMPSAARACY